MIKYEVQIGADILALDYRGFAAVRLVTNGANPEVLQVLLHAADERYLNVFEHKSMFSTESPCASLDGLGEDNKRKEQRS